jgi:hypothetical protein
MHSTNVVAAKNFIDSIIGKQHVRVILGLLLANALE